MTANLGLANTLERVAIRAALKSHFVKRRNCALAGIRKVRLSTQRELRLGRKGSSAVLSEAPRPAIGSGTKKGWGEI
jgi:hypothetical protein